MISERLTFESQGLSLGGRIVTPNSGIASRAVVCITGGGLDDCDVSYLELQEYLAAEGFASLAFNARGIGDSEGSFRIDSPGYDGSKSPANSQSSRTLDSLQAYALLKASMGIRDDEKMGVIGGSMGGDIAVHALDLMTPGALLLRAPAAYPDVVHELEYGPAWGVRIRSLGGDRAALTSSNFKRITRLKIPQLLIYSGGDTVIPREVQDTYIAATASAGGSFVSVGDDTTPHHFLALRLKPEVDTLTNARAREQTYKTAAEFFTKNLKG